MNERIRLQVATLWGIDHVGLSVDESAGLTKLSAPIETAALELQHPAGRLAEVPPAKTLLGGLLPYPWSWLAEPAQAGEVSFRIAEGTHAQLCQSVRRCAEAVEEFLAAHPRVGVSFRRWGAGTPESPGEVVGQWDARKPERGLEIAQASLRPETGQWLAISAWADPAGLSFHWTLDAGTRNPAPSLEFPLPPC